MQVPPRHAVDIALDAPAGRLLQWDFYSIEHDIAFSVHYHGVFRFCVSSFADGSGALVELVPTTRVESHVIPEHGTLHCEKVDPLPQRATDGAGGQVYITPGQHIQLLPRQDRPRPGGGAVHGRTRRAGAGGRHTVGSGAARRAANALRVPRRLSSKFEADSIKFLVAP
jgi:hypothetical protein